MIITVIMDLQKCDKMKSETENNIKKKLLSLLHKIRDKFYQFPRKHRIRRRVEFTRIDVRKYYLMP